MTHTGQKGLAAAGPTPPKPWGIADMLWEAIIGGLTVLTFWQTYVAAIEYLAIVFIPMALMGAAMERSPSAGMPFGCLGMFLVPVLQVAAMTIFALTLSPIIFGFAHDAAWDFPWKVITASPVTFLKLVGVLVAVSFILAFIPVVGALQSLQTLVLGGIALAFVLGLMDVANPGVLKRVTFIPDIWMAIGLLAIGALLSWVGFMVAGIVVAAFDWKGGGFGQMIGFPIAAVFGFLPMFMYGAWLGAQVRVHY